MKYFVITILAGLLLSPILVSASDFDLETLLENLENNTSVQTNVNVKVNTGGNVATSNQKIITGSYQVDVRIENQVDGEKQQPIEIHLDSNDNPTSYSETRKSANSTTSIEVKVADDGVDVTASNQVNTDELAEDSPDQVSAESGVADDNQPSVVDTIITFIKNAFKGIFSKIFN